MRAYGLGFVVAVGPDSKFSVGDVVSGSWGECNAVFFFLLLIWRLGMTEYAVMKDAFVEKIMYDSTPNLEIYYVLIIFRSVPKGAQPLDFLNTLGVPGAYIDDCQV